MTPMRWDKYHAGGQPVPRDPLSIGIAIITAVETVSGVAIGFEAASFVGSVVITGALIGANLLLASSAPDGSGSLGAMSLNTQELRINRRQPTPHKKIHYGIVETGGDLFFEEVKAPNLTHGWLLAGREIEGFLRARIGTDEIAILSTTELLPVNQIITPQGKLDDTGAIVATPDYATNLRLSLRTGTAAQTIDPLLLSEYSSLDSSFRQRGIVTAVLRYTWPGTNYDDRQAMWGDSQAPNPMFRIKAVRVYDPRDPTQLRDDETTWKWSENATLIIADFLRQPYGGRIDAANIDYERVAEAADYDDELVGTVAGDLIKRHTINGTVVLNQPPVDVLRGMLSANRGRVCEQAGQFWISSSRPKTPVLTIDDGMLAGGIDYQPAKPKRDLVNRVFTRFISSERDYQQVDGPVYDRPDLQVIDGEIFAATLTLPFTLDYRRVERLQKQYLETARLGKNLTLRVSLDALAISESELLDEVITFDSDLFSPANGNYRVVSVGFADNYASVELSLMQYDGDIETDWIPADDERDFTIAALDVT